MPGIEREIFYLARMGRFRRFAVQDVNGDNKKNNALKSCRRIFVTMPREKNVQVLRKCAKPFPSIL
jgi:hypothetical protein